MSLGRKFGRIIICAVFIVVIIAGGYFITVNFLRGLDAYRNKPHLIGKDTAVYWNNGVFRISTVYGKLDDKYYTFDYDGETVIRDVDAYRTQEGYVYIISPIYYIVIDLNNVIFTQYKSIEDIDEIHRIEFEDSSEFTYLVN